LKFFPWLCVQSITVSGFFLLKLKTFVFFYEKIGEKKIKIIILCNFSYFRGKKFFRILIPIITKGEKKKKLKI
jgi:hypothetical protein